MQKQSARQFHVARIVLAVLFLFLGLLASNTALAEEPTANWFYDNCNVNNPAIETEPEAMLGIVACINYMNGLVDSYQFMSNFTGQELICLPEEGMSGQQKVMVAHKYVSEHPEDLHDTRRIVAFIALKTFFPCDE